MVNSMKLNSYHMHGALHVKGSLTVNGAPLSPVALKAQFQQHETSINDHTTRISELEGEIAGHNTLILNSITSINTLLGAFADLSARVSALEG